MTLNYTYVPNRHQEEVYRPILRILLMKPMKQVQKKYILLSLSPFHNHEDRTSYILQQFQVIIVCRPILDVKILREYSIWFKYVFIILYFV